MAKFRRKNNTFLVLLLSILITYLFRMVLVKILGSTGMAYISVPNDLYFLFGFSASIGLEQGITTLIEVRMARGSYESAKRIIKGGLLVSLLLSIFIGFILFLITKLICGGLLDMPLLKMALLVMIISIPLSVFTGTLRGYFNGIGYRYLSTLSYIIFSVLYFIFGLIFSSLWLDYGNKVSSLLRSEYFKFTYATLGFSVSLVLASLITFIYMLVLYIIYEQRTILNNKEYAKTQESLKETIILVIKNIYIPAIIVACFYFLSFFNSILILRKNSKVDGILFEYGEFYSKSLPYVVIVTILLYIFLNVYSKRSIGAVRKDEFRAARERLSRLIHRSVTLSLFLSGMVICCAENILKILYPQNGKATIFYVYVLGILVFLLTICFVTGYILYELRYGFVLGIISVFSVTPRARRRAVMVASHPLETNLTLSIEE